ncbi:MAG: thiolase family protein, partial [Chloroflexi bacterium]|nr:thiolase family protein [Chloroflexota bacterium]
MRQAAVIGTGQTKHSKARDDVNQAELVREAAVCALTDAGLTFGDVDAIVLANMELFEGRALPEMWVGEAVGGYGKPVMKIATGGTSGTSGCIAGYHQVASGLF